MPTRTLVLDGEEAVSQGYPPRNENAQKLGDRLVFSDNITSFQFEPASPNPVAGPIPPPKVGAQHSGFCIRVRGKGENFWLCQAGFVLPGLPNTAYSNGGQIQVDGLQRSVTVAGRHRWGLRRLRQCRGADRRDLSTDAGWRQAEVAVDDDDPHPLSDVRSMRVKMADWRPAVGVVQPQLAV
jgi:hypothetical protein